MNEKKIELIKKAIAELDRKEKQIISEDPFWYFIPNDGDITPERRKVLARYLKEEDIPQKCDSQLDVILSKASIVGDSGGNRSSKTVGGTIKGIIKQTGELPESLMKYEEHFKDYVERAKNKFVRGRVTAVDNKQLHRVVLDAWKYWIPRKYLKKGNWEESYSKEFDILTLYRNKKPCGTVEFLTNSQEVKSSQGGDLDWANFDEEPDKERYKETLMRFGTADRLDIQIDWTPTEGLSWATDLFHHGIFDEDTEDREKDIELFKLTTVCNRFVNLETIIKIMDGFAKVSSYEEMKMRLLGEAISLSGLVYGNLFNRSIHVIPPFPITYKDHIIYRGIDPHLVKPTCCVELAVDREENEYVIGCYSKDVDTTDIKRDLALRAVERRYRLGWSVCDKSADSTIHVLGDRNIYRELKMGENFIPALFTSEKYEGSIKAGVDQIKQLLKINDITKKPKLFIFDMPENKPLIQAFMTLERETYTNEDKKGKKDRIAEGRHDAHACLRYCHQRPIRWIPYYVQKPQPVLEEKYI